MKKRILALALAAALSLGLLAGCGGDTNGGDTATPTPAADNTDTPSTQAPDDGGGSAGEASGTFTIGFIGPLTGGAAIYGTNVRNAAQIAVDEINALGGAVQLSLIEADDTNDPEAALNAYNSLMDQGMQILLGTVTTKPALNVVPQAYEDRVFTITPSASGGCHFHRQQ